MRNHSCDVIIIGAGVAGLAAAAELGRHRLRVIVLEARDRLGGRIATLRRRGWSAPIELGAQFVHAGNDDLWSILRRHRIATKPVPPHHWRFGDGEMTVFDATKAIAAVTNQIDEKRMRGWSFAEFLREKGQSFSKNQRDVALGFVEGFEAAPITEMSATAVAGETIEDDAQFFVPRGYEMLVRALTRSLNARYVDLLTNHTCSTVEWRRDHVIVETPKGRFSAPKLIITVPLGVLQAKASQRGAIAFRPGLGEHERVIAAMGMGHVIRINLRFDGTAWRKLLPSLLQPAAAKGFGFIHSRLEKVPVWWSISGNAVVTGWSGGPNALALAGRSRCAIEQIALGQLSRVLGTTKASLARALADAATHNWSRDPFSRGAYSFTRAGQEGASAKLRKPVAATLYFAGEATADGAEVGTVHGALSSGLRAAQEILRRLR